MRFRRFWQIGSLAFMILAMPATGQAAEPVAEIAVEHVRRLDNPFDDPRAHGNSFRLSGFSPDGPLIAVSWSTSYENCILSIYDFRFNEIARWREPLSDGDKVMIVKTGDLDGDGVPEILATIRSAAPGAGVVCLAWNSLQGTLEKKWGFHDVEHGDLFYRGLAIGNFTPHPGLEVIFGNSNGTLYLLDAEGKFLGGQRMQPAPVIQEINAADFDGDGTDEIILSTGRAPGKVIMVAWDHKKRRLQTRWSTNVTPARMNVGDNCYEAVPHPQGNPNGGWGIAAATEQEIGVHQGSILLLDRKGKILWQRKYSPDEGRPGGCEFADVTGDGIPEILSRYAVQEGGHRGLLIFDNQGNRLAKIPNVTTSSAGPYVIRPNGPGTAPVYLVAEMNVYRVKIKTGVP